MRGFSGDRMFQCTDSAGMYCTPRDDDKVRLFHVKPALSISGVLTLRAQGIDPLICELSRAVTQRVSCSVLCAPSKIELLDYGDAVAEWLQRATGISGVRLTGLTDDCGRVVCVNPDQGDPHLGPG